MRILIIHEDNVMANELARQITQMGHDVDVTSEHQTALTHLKEQRYDTVISEFWSFSINGMGIVYTVKESTPSTKIVIIRDRKQSVSHSLELVDKIIVRPSPRRFTQDEIKSMVF